MPDNDMQTPTLLVIPKRSKRDWHRTTCDLPKETVAGLDDLAQVNGVSRGDLIAFACQQLLESQAAA